MRIFYTSALILLFSMFSTLSFGQVKQITKPNISSPFKSKKVIAKKSLIIPRQLKKDSIKTKIQIDKVKGSFVIDLSMEKKSVDNTVKELNKWLELDHNTTFQFVTSNTDELKFRHDYYQQYYKGIIVEGSVIMIHSKDGIVKNVNGQIAELSDLDVQAKISKDEAKIIAMQFAKVKEVSNDYPIEVLICRIPSEKGFDFNFTYKVRIDSFNPFVMSNIYIDAKNGSVVNSINLIAHADTPAFANTLYSGTQSITSDSYSGSYRLRDNLRKIETYDATNATGITSSGFTNSTDYTNNSTTWGTFPSLTSFTISTISQNWWYSAIGDTSPDLYIKVKNSSNVVVYDGRNSYINNTFPSVTFNLYIPLVSQPYTVEIWDYDPVGGDDFGGSYTITSTSGNWSLNGNTGSYNVLGTTFNPALDVHWGMEKTFDFYLNIFNRNSYDGNGSVIKNYLNPPTLQTQYNNSPNNAGALPAPYNVMQYGLGDNITMKAVVGLDVEGHEYSHMVVANRNLALGGLVYQGESGALNESFADIFGTCVEFYAKPSTANWTIGEDLMLPNGTFLRSMSNPNGPNSNLQPDTYKGYLWLNTNCGTPTNLNDNCGVHRNSGVQNYWFYLLSQGGSGTNDLGNTFNVTGIGINKARQIAYLNLTTYLGGQNSTYIDSYNGSLLAAQALYGNPSVEYFAVKNAWYAVGIGNDNPNLYCSGTTSLTNSTGTITDGSSTANYNNNSTCKWVIAPPGATQISLNFTSFDTETTYDLVNVYDGPDDTYPLLATWYGNTLPPTITTSAGVGAMCIKFTSDATATYGGWSANYTSVISTPACSGVTMLTTPTGTFSDGSGSNNYTNNQQCYWYIAPPCATSVTLSFSTFNTELNFDGVVIYDSLNATNQLGVYSGTNLPASVTSNTGAMLVVFVSDFSTSLQGFNASYTSLGSSYCSGVTTLNTSDYGTISDGSGANNYCNNSNCSWLIQPPQATSISLKFTQLDLENSNSADGLPIYDAVEIYDGNSASANLLGIFTGSNIPQQTITSTGGSMFIKFYSDISVTKQGWSANYTSTQNSYCNSTTSTLTAPSGTFTDGSGLDKYANNSNCSWLIQPPSASSITLSFSAFDTELNFDGVIVYDGANSSAPVLGQFTGTTIPSSVTSTGGSMYVVFLSDEALRSNGWNASYNSTTLGINDFNLNDNIKIYPNPTTGVFTIQSSLDDVINVQLFDVLGKQVLKTFKIEKGIINIDVSDFSKGIYLIKLSNQDSTINQKLIIK